MKNLKIIKVNNCNFHIYLEQNKIDEFLSLIKKIPAKYFSSCKNVYIYPTEFLKDKQFDAFSQKDSILINPDQIDNNKDLLKNIMHELYHLSSNDIKNSYNEQYQNVCSEYIKKKNKVLDKIRSDNRFQKPKAFYYKVLTYNRDFDNYLFNIINYNNLYTRIEDLFPNAYSMTSVDEYIAVCIEVFFFENNKWLSMYCPEVFKLIKELENE